MKRFLSFAVITFSICSTLFGLSEDKHFSLMPEFSLQNGRLIEYVFMEDGNTQSETKMSELDWPLANIAYLGGKFEFGWKNFELNGDIKFAVSHASGKMHDYDWLDYVYDYEDGLYKYNDSTMCTNCSITENELLNSYIFNIKAGARFNPISTLQIIPMAGIIYNNTNFYSANGSMWYGLKDYTGLPYNIPYTDERVKEKSTNDAKYIENNILIAISYDKEWFSFTLGMNAFYTLFNNLTLGVNFYTAPYTYIRSIDHHFSSDTYYLDIMSDFFKYWNYGISVEYRIWKGLSAYTAFDYHLQNLIKGETYSALKEPKFYKKNKSDSSSGSEASWWNLDLGLKWNF